MIAMKPSEFQLYLDDESHALSWPNGDESCCSWVISSNADFKWVGSPSSFTQIEHRGSFHFASVWTALIHVWWARIQNCIFSWDLDRVLWTGTECIVSKESMQVVCNEIESRFWRHKELGTNQIMLLTTLVSRDVGRIFSKDPSWPLVGMQTK